MTVKSISLVTGVLILSGVVGWWRAGVNAADVPLDRDMWAQFNVTELGGQEYAAIATRLKASDIFPLSREETAAVANASVAQTQAVEEGLPPFPKIISAFAPDGVPSVTLLLADNSMQTVVSGDSVEPGWELKLVDSQRVIAVYEGEEREFPVINYGRGTAPEDTDAVGDEE